MLILVVLLGFFVENCGLNRFFEAIFVYRVLYEGIFTRIFIINCSNGKNCKVVKSNR